VNAPPVTTTGRLPGSRVVVTGGARGIGGAIAERFAAEGANVAILDRLVEQGRAHAEAIGGTFVEVDLADPADAAFATASAIAGLGGVDVLVNVAGIFELTPLLDIQIPAWDRMFAVNARAMLVTMQTAAPRMIAQRHGSIVNLASMAAKHGGAMEAHYAASKAAVVALSRSAAAEWGPHGVRVNSICPGFIPTAMGADGRDEALMATWRARSPLGRLGEASDVASTALFLASDEACYLTGQAINVTGGMITH
jgi:3-oxoacyl-[acyl-carrier protein] reductase